MSTDDLRTLLDRLDPLADAPRLIAAVEAVLKLHGPLPVYLDASDCGCVDEDHAIIDSIDGDPLCSGSPTGDHYCDECTPEECGAELVEYPCPTVTAIHAALIGEDDE